MKTESVSFKTTAAGLVAAVSTGPVSTGLVAAVFSRAKHVVLADLHAGTLTNLER